ncbi:cytochrome P450 [Streptomyces sp. DSM 41921]|uniref:Cytochrome P450 n=1 Tax=Streptomyces dubilierae TaxID=3075533 RepID=A0ABU2PAX9_9ACTN|nr:cytochrome P450 [Streptomyces sp. DSM 41921]MDT0388804.1 cytochrome P450 [Streptomyces sp. DSM 41921]
MNGCVPNPEQAWTVGTAPGIFPSIGHGIALFRRPLEFLNSLPAQGDLVEIRLGPQRAWMVCHPELVHRMLRDSRTFDKGGPQYERLRALMGGGVVTCPHAEHRRQRRLLQPTFRPSAVAGHTDLMAQETASLCRDWRDGQRVDVSAAMLGLTTRLISRVLLSDALGPAAADEVRRCLAVIVRGLFVRTVVPVDVLFRLPTPANRRYRRAVERTHELVDAAMAERRRGAPRDDLLGLLLAAAGRDGEDGEETPVTDREIHDQLVSLLLTGSESPSMCLASTFSLLARHPEVERRLHAEVDSVLAGRLPEAGDLPRLVYTRAVLTETLRHSPPGWLFTRVTTRETELAGRRLPRGTTVLYSPYLLHHDPASFPEPERFRPERWLEGEAAAGPHGALIPFAAGSRKCIGDLFSLAEMTVALATLAGRWRLSHPPGPVAPPRPGATLGPRSLTMICRPRAQAPGGAAARAALAPGAPAVAPAVGETRRDGDQDVHHA